MSVSFFEPTISCWGTPAELLVHPQQRVLSAFSKRSEPEPLTEISICWIFGISQHCNTMDMSHNAKERRTKNPVACSDQGYKITAWECEVIRRGDVFWGLLNVFFLPPNESEHPVETRQWRVWYTTRLKSTQIRFSLQRIPKWSYPLSSLVTQLFWQRWEFTLISLNYP